MKLAHRDAGFSLVELSIVLVILGLLVGGVLAGRSLIRAAEVRAILTEVDGFRVAVNSFRLRFNALPGDMRDFSNFYPACVQYTAHNRCNGDGDGRIGGFNAFHTAEGYRAFEHLAKSGLIEGTYSASTGNTLSGYYNIASGPFPLDGLAKSRYHDSARYVFAYTGNEAAGNCNFANKLHCDREILMLGKVQEVSGSWRFPSGGSEQTALFTPTESILLDQKVDDGQALTGRIVGMHWGSTGHTCLGGGQYSINNNRDKDAYICNLLFDYR